MEHEFSAEVPELMNHADRLVGTNPHSVFEAVEFPGPRRPSLHVDDPESPEMQMHGMSPAALTGS